MYVCVVCMYIYVCVYVCMYVCVYIYIYTDQNYKHFCFCPHFSWAELKDPILFLCTQKAYFSQICPRLATIKGHNVTSICLTQCNTSPSYRVDQVVDCGLWNVGPLLLNGLFEVVGYWQELEHAVVFADPEHPKHAQWVTCPVSMLVMQELGCFQLPGIKYRSLQHGAMHYHDATWGDGKWHNNGPQDLVTVSLCIQNAINKMHLCPLSITYACPYHNPTVTMGHSIHSVDISKPLTHMMPYTLSAICPVQWKPGFIREENTSPKCQRASNVSICPLKLVMTTNCSQVETPMRMASMQMSFPETVSDRLCRNSLVIQTVCCNSRPGGFFF